MTTRSAFGLSSDHGDWRTRAACGAKDVDPDLHHPVRGSGPAGARYAADVAAAQVVCRRCPVISDCLSHALTHPRDAQHGVWGGLSEEDRDEVRRGRRWVADPVARQALRDLRLWQAQRDVAS